MFRPRGLAFGLVGNFQLQIDVVVGQQHLQIVGRVANSIDAQTIVVEKERVLQKVVHRQAFFLLRPYAAVDHFAHVFVLHSIVTIGLLAGRDTLDDGRRSLALDVRILADDHLQHAQAKRVDVDELVVLLVEHLRCHELHRAAHALGERLRFEGRQTEIADLHTARRARDEDVVAFQVSMNDRRISAVQIGETFENLTAPFLHHIDTLVFLLSFEFADIPVKCEQKMSNPVVQRISFSRTLSENRTSSAP